MTQVERITKIVKFNLKLKWENQVYVIIVMHKYLLKGLQQLAPVAPPVENANNNGKDVVFKNFTPFTDCIS